MTSPVIAADPALVALAQAPEDSANPAADTVFAQPYIDKDEWRDGLVRHRYVHGGFKGTETRFSIYLPPRAQYEGRFFQHLTPVPDSENLAQGKFATEEDKIAPSRSPAAAITLRPTAAERPMPACREPAWTRDGDMKTPFARIRNLGRVRVVVEE